MTESVNIFTIYPDLTNGRKIKMLVIDSKKDENGNIWYSFESRGTSYSIRQAPFDIYQDKNLYEVWSKRVSASFDPQAKMMTLKEMKKRAKVLKSFADFITTENSSSIH